MIERIITRFNEIVADLGLISDTKGLLLESRYGPAEMDGPEDMKPLDLENYPSLVYYSRLRDTSLKILPDEGVMANTTFQERTYGLRMLVYAPRSLSGGCAEYADEILAETLAAAICSGQDKKLADETGAERVSYYPQNFRMNARKLWEEQFPGQAFVLGYDKVFFALDFEIIIGGRSECFATAACI